MAPHAPSIAPVEMTAPAILNAIRKENLFVWLDGLTAKTTASLVSAVYYMLYQCLTTTLEGWCLQLASGKLWLRAGCSVASYYISFVGCM